MLRRVGVDDKAREVVFFGADKGNEDVVFRQNTLKVQQQFARSITLENAMKPEPLLAWALNGQPLDRDHGFPLRVIMPGWYGVANVKWLSEIHLQENRFLGNFQARWYRTVRAVGGTGELTDPETQFVETEVSKLNLKSVIARVRKTPARTRFTASCSTTARRSARSKSRSTRARGSARRSIRRTRSIRGSFLVPLGGRDARRAHARLARHGRQRRRSTHGRGAGAEEDVPRGQLAVPAQGDDCVVG